MVAGLVGFLAVVIPGWLRAEISLAAPLFPWVVTSVQLLPPVSYVLLFFCGYTLARINPNHPWLLGLSTIWFFPVFAVMEKSLVITTHSYFALEFLFYLLLGLAGVAGSYAARIE